MPRHDGGMEVTVRSAALEDGAEDLLYVSAQRYYDAYAGGEATARRLLRRVHARPGHPASVSLVRVAEAEGRIVGAIVGFPAGEGEELAQRFLALTAWRIPPWRWRGLLRHLNAASGMSPAPAPGSWYVDALAVAPDARRRGVARALLADAEAIARAQGASGVSLDTGLENTPARRLYEANGYAQRDIRRARDERAARAIGGAGFIGFFKRV
ncbi:MAG: GNAT family N-acetyltransferase [Solirubrobacteraceae bacterium]